MRLNKIEEIVKNLKSEPMEIKNKYSIFVPFIEVEKQTHLLFEVRSKNLNNQPGEICFPGGKIEKHEDYIQAAIRETCEELLISKVDLDVFNGGDFLVNSYGSVIYTTVGEITKSIENIFPNKEEVEGIFTVPLNFFFENEPDIYEVELIAKRNDKFPYSLIPNGEKYDFKRSKDRVIFYQYEDKIIWGFTAKVIYNLINKLKSNKI